MDRDYRSHHFCSDPIRGKHERHFHCPACSAHMEEDPSRSCSPYDCPEEVPTPKYTGPTRVLPPEEHEQLKECIHEVNDLLLAFSDERDPHMQESLRFKFRSMRGRFVRVCLKCDEEEILVDGELSEAGKDFLEIDNFDDKTFILYHQICHVKQSAVHPHAKGSHGGELAHLNDCCRRELILNFGRVVADNPYLINIFFGIKLHMFLIDYIGCVVVVTLNDSEEVEGCLISTDEEAILLKKDNEEYKVDFDSICLLKVGKHSH